MRRWAVVALLLLACGLPAAAAKPAVVWKALLGGRIYTSPLVCDLRTEPGLETVVCDSESRQVVCLDARGKVLWRFGEGFDARLTPTPSAADLNGDDRLEVIQAGGGGNLVCLDAAGKLVWRLKLEGDTDWSAPAVADLDGDRKPEIVVGTSAGCYCVSGAGKLVWKAKRLGWTGTLPTLADLDGNGKREVLVAADRFLWVLDAAGETLWKFEALTTTDGASVGDVDADGQPEVIVPCDEQFVYCLDGAGKVEWTYAGGYSGGADGWLSPPALVPAQPGKPGPLDIILGDGNGSIRCLDAKGHERWLTRHGWPIGEGPTAGDLDGDGGNEAVVGYDDDGTVLCLGADGREKWRFMADFRVTTSPSLADIDADGRAEVIVAGNDGYVYCLRPPGKAGVIGWPMRRGDAAQTGVAGRER